MAEVVIERPAPWVALLRINRAEARNALSQTIRQLLAEQFTNLDSNPQVRCIVLTGRDANLAAGADIRDIVDRNAIEMMLHNTQRFWQVVADCPKPIIAAVNGHAWDGGCKLAMHAIFEKREPEFRGA